MDWTVVRHKRRSAGRPSTVRTHDLSAGETKTAADPLAGFHFTSPEAEKLDRDTSHQSFDIRKEEVLLLGKMQRAVAKVERSVFFTRFMKQIQDLDVFENLKRSRRAALGFRVEQPEDGEDMSEEVGSDEQSRSLTVELVVYGVGSISNSEISRCQLSLALLLQRKVPSIGNILVYDPIMSALDRGVMVHLGCSPLEDNEDGRRALNGPTLFYMPHCDVELYESVLQANLKAVCVDQLVILGNSFRTYQERWSVNPLPHGERPSCLLTVQTSVEEIPVTDGFSPTAFNDTSWHFFSKVDLSKLS